MIVSIFFLCFFLCCLEQVLDPFQVLVATQLSAEKHHEQSMKTRSVYSEIVYSMSANKKVEINC